jgi:hypothetical protein
MAIYNIQFAPSADDLQDTKYGLAQNGVGTWRLDKGINQDEGIWVKRISAFARKVLHDNKDLGFVDRAYQLYYLDSYTGAGVWVPIKGVSGTIK